MTPSQLPVGLRIQQTIAAFYRAGHPSGEIADAIGLTPSTCEELVDAMRRAGWTLQRPRGAHEHIQIDNTLLLERYRRRRAQARRRGEQLSLSELARTAGLVRPGREPRVGAAGAPLVGLRSAAAPGPGRGGVEAERRALPRGAAIAPGRAGRARSF